MHVAVSAIAGISVSPCGVGKTGSIRRAVTRTARLLPGPSEADVYPWSPLATPKIFGQVRVHVLYKRAEIPANTAILAFAISVSYREQEKAANTGSTPVSATKFS